VEVDNDGNLISEILIELGKVNQYRGDDIQALEFYNLAIESAEQVNNYRLLGTCYSSIGNIFRVLGAYDESLSSIVRAKSNYELAGFVEGSAWISYTIGRLYRDLGIQDEAKTTFGESLEIYTSQAEINGDSMGVALCLDQLGMINLKLNEPALAKIDIQRSLHIYTENKSEYGLSNAQKNMGKIAYTLGEYSNAEKFLEQSLDTKIRIDDALGIPGIYIYLGLTLIAEDQWQVGMDILQVGLVKAKNNHQRQIQFEIYGHMAKAFEDKGQLAEALKYYKLQFNHQDLILADPVRFKLPELRGIYEMEQSRQKIKSLNP